MVIEIYYTVSCTIANHVQLIIIVPTTILILKQVPILILEIGQFFLRPLDI